jgi:hypothetical protein
MVPQLHSAEVPARAGLFESTNVTLAARASAGSGSEALQACGDQGSPRLFRLHCHDFSGKVFAYLGERCIFDSYGLFKPTPD